MHALGILPYNNPFIATLIPNDDDYLKLINNLHDYLNLEPILGDPCENSLFSIQNNSKWYKHPTINIPYPVIYIGDIEIHCIHENDNIICLEKFIRRFNRMKEIIESNNYKIISLLSLSEIINEHNDFNIYLDNYFSKDIIIPVEKYFLGPPRLNLYDNYIPVHEWNNISAERDDSHIYKFNNQEFNKIMFLQNIKLL